MIIVLGSCKAATGTSCPGIPNIWASEYASRYSTRQTQTKSPWSISCRISSSSRRTAPIRCGVLRRLQQRIIDAVAPFAVEQGTGEAFAPRPDGGAISQPTVDYVNNFVGPRTGMNYHPHLTVGIGTRDFVDALKAEPFEAFTVRPVSVSLYQVGDYGVAQRKLYRLETLPILQLRTDQCASHCLLERRLHQPGDPGFCRGCHHTWQPGLCPAGGTHRHLR